MSTKFDNSGSIRLNDRKEKDSQPDYRGKATIDGAEFWISGWKKKNDDGYWLSLSFQRKDDAPPAKKPNTKPLRNDDDDLPAF